MACKSSNYYGGTSQIFKVLRIISCWGRRAQLSRDQLSAHVAAAEQLFWKHQAWNKWCTDKAVVPLLPLCGRGLSSIQPSSLPPRLPSSSTKSTDFRSSKFCSTMALSYERQKHPWHGKIAIDWQSMVSTCHSSINFKPRIHLSWNHPFSGIAILCV